MSYENNHIQNKGLFKKIKIISNKRRFRIVELTQQDRLSITQLSSKLNLAYTKCADYVTMLERNNLVQKIKEGKEIKVINKVKLSKNKIEFL